MRKSHSYDELSDKRCKCGKRIKARLADRFDTCYACYAKAEALRGHFINVKPRKKRLDSGLPTKTYQSWTTL